MTWGDWWGFLWAEATEPRFSAAFCLAWVAVASLAPSPTDWWMRRRAKRRGEQ